MERLIVRSCLKQNRNFILAEMYNTIHKLYYLTYIQYGINYLQWFPRRNLYRINYKVYQVMPDKLCSTQSYSETCVVEIVPR